ncbi:hypothetical protein ACIP98_33650 [Streptomyces sp. NPDC088354]|uniref:hypothetical protein n=1 Tax=Streptomyces sp. NPDC088354 TaxID=3365856 RepID=UPI00381E1E05
MALSAPVGVSKGTWASSSFSPDGRTLALGTVPQPGGTAGGDVQLRDVADPRRPRRLTTVTSVTQQGVASVALSPDGTTPAVSGGTTAGDLPLALAFRPGLPLPATVDSGGGVRLRDVSSAAQPVEVRGRAPAGQTEPVAAPAFDARGHTLIAAGLGAAGRLHGRAACGGHLRPGPSRRPGRRTAG